MNSNLLFDFSVNKEKNNITVKREFAAEKNLVWAAWTDPEILDEWWAPKPYKVTTKSMDFTVGGFWLYAMRGPEGDVHWCRADYKSIDAENNFSGLDAFCDEDGNITQKFPRSFWNNTFIDKGEKTEVEITIQYDSLTDLETILEMGFKEGFTMAMGNLDDYFAEKK